MPGATVRRWMTGLATIAAAVACASVLRAGQAGRDTAKTQPTPVRASIAGTVVAADTGRAVRRATVTIAGLEPKIARSVETDDQGNFSVTGLTAGEYMVTVNKGGYVESIYGQKTPGSGRPGIALRLVEGQHLTRLSVPLARGGALTGTIVDEGGEPVFGMQVRALRWVMRSGERTLQPVASATTDDRGVYRLHSLLPGEYVVTATPLVGIQHLLSLEGLQYAKVMAAAEVGMVAGIEARYRVAEGERPSPPRTGFAAVYYPGTTIASVATSIPIGPGEERGGVDIPMQVVPLTRVTGTITIPGGAASGTGVQLVESGPHASSTARTARADASGRFTFEGVPPGQYQLLSKGTQKGAPRLEASTREAVEFLAMQERKEAVDRVAQAISGVAPYWAMADVVVDGRGPIDVPLVMQPGLSVSGRVTFDSGVQAPNLSRLTVGLVPVGAQKPVADFASTGPAVVDASGQFTIRGVTPGRYRLAALGGMPAGFFVQSVVFGGQDILDFPMSIDGSRNVGDGIVTLSSRSTEIAGAIQDDAGRGVPGFTVIAFPADERLWTTESRRIQAVRPATDGRYAFRNLPAGDYRLVVVSDVEPGRWYDAAYLKQLSGFATVALAPGARLVQDFKVR